jgi:hypothetical protein
VTDRLTIDPLLICLGPEWIHMGKCTLSAARNCALVIPLSESADKGLKLSALGSSEMGRKDFPGSDPVISRESQMCPPQQLHPQRLRNAPKMISSSKFDEKPGNRSILPSFQLDRRGILEFSPVGTSRLIDAQKLCSLPGQLCPHCCN